MKEAADFFSSFRESLIAGLYTSAIGQIENYDATAMKADVKLLPDGDLITAVPVAQMQTGKFVIRLPYKKGDYVLVSFCMRDIDGIMHEDRTEPTGRMLSIDDAVVVCGINLFTKPLLTQVSDTKDNNKQTVINPNDLVIASKDFKDRIIMQEAGGIKMYSDHDAGIEMVAPMGITIRADNPAGNGVRVTGKLGGETW